MSKKRIFTQEEIDLIIQLYKDMNSLKSIAQILHTKSEKISCILKEKNIPIHSFGQRKDISQLQTNKKYNFDEHYFEEIDSYDKAYWLGFLYADGNVYIRYCPNGSTKGGTVGLKLKREDDYHLRNFVRFLNGNIPVKHDIAKCNGKEYETARLDINSIIMCKDLVRHGCVPNKSLILQFPEHIEEEYYSSFIKGYFDGDGCIGYYPKSNSSRIYLGICGTKEFLERVKDILIQNNINSINIIKDKRSNVYVLYINGRKNMCKFYNYVYNHATCIIGRKKDLFTQALLDLNQPLNISPIAKLAFQI